MLKVTKDQISGGTLVTMTGSIDEGANFDALLGTLSGEVTLHCMGITRINSAGIKAWIRYFAKQQIQGARLKFKACSVFLIEQANLISNFLCGGAIESLYLPYLCENCGLEHNQLCKADDLKKNRFKAPEVKCPDCGSTMVFDSDPADYFSFLMN